MFLYGTLMQNLFKKKFYWKKTTFFSYFLNKKNLNVPIFLKPIFFSSLFIMISKQETFLQAPTVTHSQESNNMWMRLYF